MLNKRTNNVSTLSQKESLWLATMEERQKYITNPLLYHPYRDSGGGFGWDRFCYKDFIPNRDLKS